MNLAIAATVFGIVALAELPDKTMIATLIMGSRNRPLLVWAGASAAFVLHAAVAVGAGRLVLLLPHRVLEVVTTTLFLAGALYLLLVPERHEEEAGEEAAAEAEADVADGAGVGGEGGGGEGGGSEGGMERAARARSVTTGRGPWRVAGAAFGVILVGEFGDLTQILVLNLSARYREPVPVFVGAVAALVTVAALGAWSGRALLRWLPVAAIRRGGGVMLLGFATYGIYSLVR